MSRIEELKELISKKKAEANEIKKMADQYNAMQLALKIVLNSSYGAMANKHFACFCIGVASTITAHGRDLIQYMESSNEYYWYNIFHKDNKLKNNVSFLTKVLQYLNENNIDKESFFKSDKKKSFVDKINDLKTVIEFTENNHILQPLNDNYVDSESRSIVDVPKKYDVYVKGVTVRAVPVSAYCDTDSLFCSLTPMFDTFNIQSDKFYYTLYISTTILQDYFTEKLEEYAIKYKVKNIQVFELEQVCKSIIFLAKKMYIKNVLWQENIFFKDEQKLEAKGIELVKSSSAPFIRGENGIYKVINYFFKNPKTYNNRELVNIVKDMKIAFKKSSIEDISMSSSCSKYEDKVLDDDENMSVEKGTHVGVKAAALHNYLLNNNPKYKQKYNTIKSGQKIKIYYTTNIQNKCFGYTSGQYPKELAEQFAPIDYDIQFQKCILDKINRFNIVLKLSELNNSLTVKYSLF